MISSLTLIKTPTAKSNFLTAYLTHPLSLLTIAALLVRVAWLGLAPLWYDETGSVWMASLPWAQMLEATAGDVHPPLYLALLWAWVRVFGTSEFAVRIPSLLASVASVPMLYSVARKFGASERHALWACALMVFVPVQLHYAQEARMYALFVLLFLCALWCALDGKMIELGALMAGLALTQNYGVMYAGVAWLVALLKHGRTTRTFFWLAVALIVAQLLYFPWLPTLREQLAFVGSGAWWAQRVTAGSVLYVFYMLLFTFSTPDHLSAHAALMLFPALIISMAYAIKDKHRPALIAWIVALLPIAAATVVSVYLKPVLLFRALLPSAPLLYLALVYPLAQATRRALVAVAILTVPIIAVSSVSYYLTLPNSKGNPAQYLNVVDYQIGDVAYYSDEGPAMMLHFYRPQAWQEYVMPPAAINMGALSDRTRTAMGMEMVDLKDLQWRRAWLFVFSGPTTAQGQDEAVARLLAEYTYQVVYAASDSYTNTKIYLLFNKWVGVQ